MAGFKTHISVSTACGIGYGLAGYYYFDVPADEAILAGTLCSFGGMLPDLDSNSGVPVRETFAFLSAIVPMMVMARLRDTGLPPHTLLVVGILTYFVMRFGVSKLFKKYTVHRGMWHSIPAALSVGLLVYILAYAHGQFLAIYTAVGAWLGFMSHLVLDEIWSVERKGARVRLKKSFGTALKFWTTRSLWANVSTYGKLAILIAIVVLQPKWLTEVHPHNENGAGPARQVADERNNNARTREHADESNVLR